MGAEDEQMISTELGEKPEICIAQFQGSLFYQRRNVWSAKKNTIWNPVTAAMSRASVKAYAVNA
jgi:hypothetical protein